jgi:hypothetical protein
VFRLITCFSIDYFCINNFYSYCILQVKECEVELHCTKRNWKRQSTQQEKFKDVLALLSKQRRDFETQGNAWLQKETCNKMDVVLIEMDIAAAGLLALEQHIEACKASVRDAIEVREVAGADLQFARSTLRTEIGKVGVCLVQLFPNLPSSTIQSPSISASSSNPDRARGLCPCCQKFFLANAFLLLSCDCVYHPYCL